MKTLVRLTLGAILALGGATLTATAAQADTVCHMVADINAPGGERQVCEQHEGESHQETIDRVNGIGGGGGGETATSTGGAAGGTTQKKATAKAPKAQSGQQSGQSATTGSGGQTKVITQNPDGSVSVETMPIDAYVAMRGFARVGALST